MITDRDRFIAGSGSLKKKYIDTNISRYLESIMKERKNIFETSVHTVELHENEKDKLSYIIQPIIMNGDAVGLVLVISDKNDITQLDEKLISVMAQFLGKHIEE